MPAPYPTESSHMSVARERKRAAPTPNDPSSTNHNTSLDNRLSTQNTPTKVVDFAYSEKNILRTTIKARPSKVHPAFRTSAAGNYFRSTRIKKGQFERPWMERRDPREVWQTIIPVAGFVLGFGISALMIWHGIRSVAVHNYCEVFSDNFTSWNSSVWTKEVDLGGFGFGQFQMTTGTDENVYIENGTLVIKPSLQNEHLITTNTTIDLRAAGCTGSYWTDCVATTNTTNGTIVNPVKSGRINTKLGASIKFGRVEVVAKLPAGDWLWPAIRMLPTSSVYGDWPRSGQIDIMESRGNNLSYAQGGNNIASSALHFGPNSGYDGWWRNNVKRQAFHTTYAKGYNTFGVEWSEKYIYTYINSRLQQVMFTQFDKPFYEYGQFPPADRNGTRLINPWESTGAKNSPFDQDFHLVLTVGVGGTNDWFRDGKSGKPWIDGNSLARKDFWDKRDEWYPTWKEGGWMSIKSVKMWQQSGYNGCTA